MANHCLEVTCINCFTTYCIRGCGDASRPSPEAKTMLQEKIKAGDKKPVAIDHPRCPNCGGKLCVF